MAKKIPVFIGTKNAEGIYRLILDDETGGLSSLTQVAKLPNSSSLSISPNRKFLFSTTEILDDGKMKGHGVSSYAISATKELKKLSVQPSQGNGGCYVFCGRKGKNVFLANYGSGSLTSYQVSSDGTLSPPVSYMQHEGSSINKPRQTKPHAHSVYTSPNNKFVYVADLGIDKVNIYTLDEESAKLTIAGSASLPPGSGPRHMAFSKDGEYVYVLNELTLTVSKYSRDIATGSLILEKTSPVTKGEIDDGLTCSEIRFSDDGKFIYAAKRDLQNKGRDSICVLHPENLEILQEQSAGVWIPRHFNISPCGKWLLIAGQKGNKIVVLARDRTSGQLTATENVLDLTAPMWVLFP